MVLFTHLTCSLSGSPHLECQLHKDWTLSVLFCLLPELEQALAYGSASNICWMNTEWILFRKTATRPPSQNSVCSQSLGGQLKGGPKGCWGRPDPPGSGLPRADPSGASWSCARQDCQGLESLLSASELTRRKPPSGTCSPQGSGWAESWEEKGLLSLERCSQARTRGLVSGGLLHRSRLCSANFSSLQDDPGALPPPWLQSTCYL